MVLWRDDSGFDSAWLLFAKARERDRWAGLGRSFDYITKWNPRKQDKAAWVARAEAAGSYTEIRPDKRVGLLDLSASRAWGKTKRTFWLVVLVTERTIDKEGPSLLVPEIDQQGWWTTLDMPMSEASDIEKHHRRHEQFHSEIKTDLNLERLPQAISYQLRHRASGLARLQMPAPSGESSLTGEIAPIRFTARRDG